MEKRGNQKILIALCWLMYASSYLCRYSYNSNITLIIDRFGTTNAEAGLVTTCFFFAYGVGQVVNGLLCKYYNKRFVLSGALIIACLINLSVFLGVPFYMYKYLWLVNGFVQSTLWSSLTLVLAQNLSEENMKSAVVVMATTTACGTLITYGFSALLSLTGQFKYSFLLGSIFVACTALIWFLFYNKLIVSKENVEKPTTVEENTEQTKSHTKTKLPSILIVSIICLAFFSIVNNLVKDGINTWVPEILKESFGLGDSLSIALTLVLPVVSVFGSVFTVFLNKYIKNFVSLAGVLYLLTIPFLALTMIFIRTNMFFIVLISLAVLALLMTGVNTVVTTMFPLQERDYINSGTLAGILNGFCYVGSTISSYGLGKVVDITGDWMNIFRIFLVLVIIVIAISFTLAVVLKCKKKKQMKSDSSQNN